MDLSKKFKVLLIEDNPADARLFREALNDNQTQYTFVLEHKETLSGGLKRLSQGDIDVIVLDLTLPDAVGMNTFLKAHAHVPEVPIIVMTGLNDKELSLEALSAGAQDYIVKGDLESKLLTRTLLYAIERKKSEEYARLSMRLEQNAIRQILEHAPTGIARLSKHLHLVDANSAFLKQFELTLDGSIGKIISKILENLPKDKFLQVVKEGKPAEVEGIKLRGTNQKELEEEHLFDLVVWPMVNEFNEVAGIILQTSEATEKSAPEEKKEDFMAALAHDLKTPLLGADWLLDMLLDGTLGPLASAQMQALNKLRSSHKSMLSHIQNLLELYHQEAEDRELHFQDVDASILISSCVDELSPNAEARQIKFKLELPDKLSTVTGDYLALRRVFINLLDNAIKFSPIGGIINIYGNNINEAISIAIKDNGKGIPEEELPFLFDRFWQSGAATTHASSLGLGLYLCQQIIDAHHGHIACKSMVELGTTFTVLLPINQPAHSNVKESALS